MFIIAEEPQAQPASLRQLEPLAFRFESNADSGIFERTSNLVNFCDNWVTIQISLRESIERRLEYEDADWVFALIAFKGRRE